MKLSQEQIGIIQERVESSSISIQSLKDDIVDHLCCVVEDQLGKGKNFETSLEGAIHELAPNGFDVIQQETIFLLNSTKIIVMKRVMYLVGLLSSMSFVLGTISAFMFWPGGWSGASELSIYGLFGFAFIFVPMLAYDYFKVNIQRALSEKLKIGLGVASALPIALSVVFKLLHLQGVQFLMLLGTGLFVFGFLPFLFFTMYKKSVS